MPMRTLLLCVLFLLAFAGLPLAQEEVELPPSAAPMQNEGPRLYGISEAFIDGRVDPDLPTPTPTPPPEAFLDPELNPDAPLGAEPPPLLADYASTGSPTSTPTPMPTAAPTPTPTPTVTPTPTATPTPYLGASSDEPLELNSATLEQLTTLPGIDYPRARMILSHRKAIGGFRSLGQLREVFGISEEIFLGVKPLLRVEPPASTPVPTPRPVETSLPRHRPGNDLFALPASEDGS